MQTINKMWNKAKSNPKTAIGVIVVLAVLHEGYHWLW